MLPEITEVQRLTLRPGDILAVRTDAALSPADAESIREWLRERLPDDVQVLVLDRGAHLEVIESA